MDWIKKHYDQFLLALAALALLVVSGLLILKTKSFGENFSAAQAPIIPSEKVPDVDLTGLESAKKRAEAPVRWEDKPNPFLFVADYYIIDGGIPKKPIEGFRHADSLTSTGAPNIPNRFFIKSKLPLLDPTVPKQDPDKDGFFNEDEWRGNRDPKDPTKWAGLTDPGAGTDPLDPNSHPKYVTKLFLKQWIRIPFVLLFQSTDPDPKKPDTFQINAAGRSKKTEFLKIGDTESSGKYKLEKYEYKVTVNPSTGAETDVSELTVINVETKQSVVLVLGQPTNSPDSYAEFDYQWNNKTIQVPKLKEFALQPEVDKDKLYKLIDINEAGAVIRTPDGSDYLVVPDKRTKR